MRAIQTTPLLPADWHSLKSMVSAVLRLRQRLVLVVLRRTVAEVPSMELVVGMCFQC